MAIYGAQIRATAMELMQSKRGMLQMQEQLVNQLAARMAREIKFDSRYDPRLDEYQITAKIDTGQGLLESPSAMLIPKLEPQRKQLKKKRFYEELKDEIHEWIGMN